MRLNENTRFVFIATSFNQNEHKKDKERFITDIYHFVRVVEDKGVVRGNLSIVSDWENAFWDAPGLGDILRVQPQDTCSHIHDLVCETMFIIASCHGSLNGMGLDGIIRPHDLINSIKNNVHIRNCVVCLRQCFAGAFHYTNVSDDNKNIIYIGGTGLRFSISATNKWGVEPNMVLWTANVFIFYLADWFEHPNDVDNDGHYSVMDLYKYVTFHTNRFTESNERHFLTLYLEEKVKVEFKKQQLGGVLDNQTQLEAKAVNELIKFIYLHQDCWILNAIPATSTLIEFN